MQVDDIRKVLILGTGTMGQKIALQCARYGYEVVACDSVAASLDNARARIPALAAELVEKQQMTAAEAEAALSCIRYTTRYEDAADVDLVNESILEDPELKGKAFGQLDKLCRPETIFTTNTSTLLPSMYAEATGRPDRFAALHFYGVFERNLADVMPHPGTSAETLRVIEAFARRINQVPLVFSREIPGYVSNAVFGAMNQVAIKLALVDKVVSVEDVDRAVMLHLGMPQGPFGLNDMIGLDTIYHIMMANAKLTGDAGALAFAEHFKQEYIDQGRLGAKSGRGFYTYPNPAWQRPDFLSAQQAVPAAAR